MSEREEIAILFGILHGSIALLAREKLVLDALKPVYYLLCTSLVWYLQLLSSE